MGTVGIQSLLIVNTYAICNRNIAVVVFLVVLELGTFIPNVIKASSHKCFVGIAAAPQEGLEDRIAGAFVLAFNCAEVAVTLYYTVGLVGFRNGWKSLRKEYLSGFLARQGLLRFVPLIFFSLITVVVDRVVSPTAGAITGPTGDAVTMNIVCRFLLYLRSRSENPNSSALSGLTTTLPSFHAAPPPRFRRPNTNEFGEPSSDERAVEFQSVNVPEDISLKEIPGSSRSKDPAADVEDTLRLPETLRL